MTEAADMTGRRSFLNWFLGTTLGALAGSILYPVFRFLSPPQVPEAATHEVEAGAADDPELLERGFRIIRFGVEPVILIRAGDGDLRAFSATCTHLDCIVEYQKDRRRIWCNCHSGEYDLNGRNVAGPPPRPLHPFTVHVVADAAGAQKIVLSKA